MKNKTKILACNVTASGFQQLVAFAAGLVIPSICIRYYGSTINGLVSSITQFVSYLTLLEAGIAASIIFYLYKPLSLNDHCRISAIVSAANLTYKRLGIYVIILSLILATGYALFGRIKELSSLEVFILVTAMGFSGALEFITMAQYRVLFTADQKIYILSFASIIGILCNILITVLCVVLGKSIVLLKVAAVFSVFARSLILHFYFKRNYNLIDIKTKPDYSALEKRWDALYLQILWSLQSGAPVLLATFFTDFVKVSIYTIYNLIIYGTSCLVAIFMSGLQAAFGELLSRNDQKTLSNAYFQFIYAFYAIITIISATTFSMFMPFIKLYTKGMADAEIYFLPLLGFLFCLNGFLFSVKTPQGMIVTAAGMYRETRLQTTTQGVILIGGGILLAGCFSYGLSGITFAVIASNLYRMIDLILFVNKNIIPGSAKKTFLYIFSSIIIIMVTFSLSPYIVSKQNSVVPWLLSAFFVSLVAVVQLLFISIVFQRENFLAVLGRIKIIFSMNKC